MQKTAYRRANGGSGAPGVHEDVLPKVVSAEVANWQDDIVGTSRVAEHGVDTMCVDVLRCVT